MRVKTQRSDIAQQLANKAANWEHTARQQTVCLADGVHVIVTQDDKGRIGVVRTDRHGTAVRRAEL